MLWQIETKRFIMPFPDGFTSVVYGFYKTKPLVLQPGTTGLVYHRHIDIHWNAMKHRRNRLGEIGEAKALYNSLRGYNLLVQCSRFPHPGSDERNLPCSTI